MLNAQNTTYIDVETTSLDPKEGRVIEIGLVQFINGEIKHKFKQLINPEAKISRFTTQLTGIKQKDLENSPNFDDIKDQLLEILNDTIFIAHNVNFDYGFISEEFSRSGIGYHSDRFCTVEFSRLASPEIPRHNLTTLAEHFQIPIPNRHRAFDDAYALYELMKIYENNLPSELFEMYFEKVLKRTTKRIQIENSPRLF